MQKRSAAPKVFFMIQDGEIEEKAKEFQINPANVQRDYVFGWLLAGIYNESQLGEKFILKGGNALRKAYLKNTRFSKDLDFSVVNEVDPTTIGAAINEVCQYAHDRTGVNFEVDKTQVDEKRGFDKENKQVYEARIYFKSFYGEEEIVLKVQLDVTTFDQILLPVQDKSLIHPYSDAESCVANLKCQKLEEILASKLNSSIQRGKVTDLFDLVFSIMVNNDYSVSRQEVITTFLKKTIYESSPDVAKNLLLNVPTEEYRPFWQQIIAPIFSVFDFDRAVSGFQDMVNVLFSLLPPPTPAPAFAYSTPNMGGYGRSSSYFRATPSASYFPSAERNTIISAGRSQKMVSMEYDGAERLVEPYAFEYRVRKADGRPMEYFWGWDTSGGKSGRIGIKMFIYDKIRSVSPTNYSFAPRFEIEL